MVLEHGPEHGSEWGAMRSIAAKIGCTAETLRTWVWRFENRELRRTNEILRKASDCFAQAELDRRPK